MDIKLAHAEFAYNRSPTYATKHSPFEVVYGINPKLPIELVPLPKGEFVHKEAETKAKAMMKLHAQVRARIEKVNDLYKARANKHKRQQDFNVGDLVWLHLRKEQSPRKCKNKLMPRSEGPFKILEKINDNAYKLELLGEYGVSATFNVGDLAKYVPDEEFRDLRTNSFEEEEDDASLSMENFDDLLIMHQDNFFLNMESSQALHAHFLGYQGKDTVCLVSFLGV